MTIALAVRAIHKSFNDAPLLRGVSLEIARGEITCLLGPSGSGKTTLLRIIAGLEQAESGAIIFDGGDMRAVPVHQRGFGLMFQDLALFPHRNVYQNVAFGLRMQNMQQADISLRVGELLELVGLGNLGTRDVNQLSGGEQQRVALARALAPRPRLLMFDEPLGALDRVLREQLVGDLRTILKRLQMTALYVTHDQNEAFAVADRVLIIYEGKIAQSGTPRDVYGYPVSPFVARFLGLDNLLRGRLISSHGTDAQVETAAGVLSAKDTGGNAKGAKEIVVLIRPEAAENIAFAPLTDQANVIAGAVSQVRFIAGKTRVALISDGGTALSFDWHEAIETGTRVWVKLDLNKVVVLKAE